MASNSASELASDEGINKKCSVCKEQNKNTAADKYCVDCQDYYCSECLKLHETLPALKKHKLMDTNDDTIGQLVMIPTAKCERHHYKTTVDMFCQNHDEVGCTKCMVTDHSGCKDVSYIPEMMETREIKGCQERMAALEKKFKELIDRFNNEDSDLEANKQMEIDKINSYVKQIEDKIKLAAQDALSQVEQRYQKLKSVLKGNTEEVRDQFKKYSSVKACIETRKENKSQTFVAFKQNKEKIEASEQACENSLNIELGQRVQFTIDPELKELLVERIVLGNVNIQPYSFVHKGSFNIRLPSDKNNIYVNGSCVISDGSIVLADYENIKIKLQVDVRKQQVVDEFIFKTRPTDVCSIERSVKNEIAVCLPNERKVSVIYILNNKFCSVFVINVDFYCNGIFCSDNILYISDTTKVYLVDFTGRVLKSFPVDVHKHSGNNGQLHDIYVSNKNKNIFVSCSLSSGKSLFCVNDNGEIINVISKEITWCNGLADAGNGKVFACGHDSKNVILLNERCVIEKIVIKDEVTYPCSMCFEFKSGRLYVTEFSGGKVGIFEAV